MRTRSWVLCLAAVAATAGATGCGSDESESGGGASTAAVSGSAGAKIPPAPSTEPPTRIQVSQPLAKAPPQGKTVAFLQCELPTCKLYADAAKSASAALGWKQKTITFKLANADGALRQTVGLKPDYIVMTGGTGSAQLATGMKAAHEAEIPVATYGAAEASDPEKGFAAVPFNTAAPYTNVVSDWAANDAKGEANILFVNSSQIPVFAQGAKDAAAHVKEACPGCTFEVLDVTLDELGAGKVVQKIIAALQNDPKIDYVSLMWSDLLPGLAPALRAGGLADRVKIVGGSVTDLSLKAVADGDAEAWSVVPTQSQAWLVFDAFARLSVGEELTPEYLGTLEDYKEPWIVDGPDAAKALQGTATAGEVWPGPDGWQQQYETLWKVGG
jgi:ribose transport system substrate-binding protein